MNAEQRAAIWVAYERSSQVLEQIVDNKDTPRTTIFELSAAVGVLRTLITKESQDYAHKPIQRIEVPAQRGLR